jgi:hypothetical protein
MNDPRGTTIAIYNVRTARKLLQNHFYLNIVHNLMSTITLNKLGR